MASYLCRSALPGAKVYAVDFSLPMLEEATAKPGGNDIRFLLADIGDLPFLDDTFDLITISFATRNINLTEQTLIRTFREFHRVLKVGGHFVNLETSQPSSPLVRRVFHEYVRLFVTPIGRAVSGSGSAYAYLAHTVPRFYHAEELASILVRAGFRNVRTRRLTFGVAAIHQGTKI
jgi:demethylmenaquinone methyltransferase/2-methoxy-6-polyprenyl-1,4-benzoquinol methylase